MGEWADVSLGALAAPNRGAVAIGPFGSAMKADSYVPSGVPVIRGTNIATTRAWKGDWVYITDDFADSMPRCVVRPNTLVFPHRGSVGEVGLVPVGNYSRYFLSTSLMKIELDEKKANPLFVYYFFKSSAGREEILKYASQVGTPGIGQPLASLKSFKLPYPPLAIQQVIASILGSLDDKIELNRQMNETLEAMARALFKDWFVDFGPTRAKMEGSTPYLAPEIWSLFPDRMDDEGKPEGWKISTLGEHVLNFDSKRVPVSSGERAKRHGPYPYHGATSVMDHVDDYLFDGIYVLVGEDGSVVKENGLAFTQYVWGKIWVNNHAHVLQGKPPVSTEQLLMYFQHEIVTPYITGAVQLKLSQGRMNSMPFVYAGEKVSQKFSNIVAPLFMCIRTNSDESRSLAATRDLLLPKLMSGEIRVKDAEKILEDAL
jgi:type I restriction enzyme S subunit